MPGLRGLIVYMKIWMLDDDKHDDATRRLVIEGKSIHDCAIYCSNSNWCHDMTILHSANPRDGILACRLINFKSEVIRGETACQAFTVTFHAPGRESLRAFSKAVKVSLTVIMPAASRCGHQRNSRHRFRRVGRLGRPSVS